MHDDNNMGGRMLGTFIWGALVGASAVVLSDRQSRDRLRKKLNDVLEQGNEMKENMKDKLQDTKEQVMDKAEEQLQKARKAGGQARARANR